MQDCIPIRLVNKSNGCEEDVARQKSAIQVVVAQVDSGVARRFDVRASFPDSASGKLPGGVGTEKRDLRTVRPPLLHVTFCLQANPSDNPVQCLSSGKFGAELLIIFLSNYFTRQGSDRAAKVLDIRRDILSRACFV